MKRNVLPLTLPIMLVSGVGCASKDVAQEKKTDSIQVAEKDIAKVTEVGKECVQQYTGLQDLVKKAPSLLTVQEGF